MSNTGVALLGLAGFWVFLGILMASNDMKGAPFAFVAAVAFVIGALTAKKRE
jgi:hypothetical protein